MAALHALLLLSALPLAATIEVASSCASAGVPQAVQGSSLAFYVDTGVVGDVVFKQSTSTQLTVAGGCSLEFDAERQRNVLASTTCCEVGVPAGSDLDLFVNGDVRSVFLDTLSLGNVSLRTDGMASLVSTAPLSVGNLAVFANGDNSTIGPLHAKADGMSDVAVFGSIASASIDLLNGFARMFIGAVEGDVDVVLMDGASQLRVEGTPGSKVSGAQLGAVNDIQTLNSECDGPPRCLEVALSASFWPAWNDAELVG